MGELSMGARREITKKYAREYASASKLDKGRMLDEVCGTTGWSRANARRALAAARTRKGPARAVRRKPRGRGYSYDALKVLIEIWTLSGEPCGKYLAAIMADMLAALEAHGELGKVAGRLTEAVRAELMAMSPATIDRYLAPTRKARYPAAKAATRPSATLRNELTVRRATDEMEARPGFFELDLVAHCGHSLAGEHAWTLTATDVFTGWTSNVAIKNRAHRWVVAAIELVADTLPYPVVGLDADNGSEFINHEVADWLQERDIAQTRSRPYKKNDQATVESKNNHVVRKRAFHWRYDTAEELALLNELWPLVSMRLNFYTPTKKPIGYVTRADGRRTRLYDKPRTAWQRVLESGLLSKAQARAAQARIAGVNPADLTRRINQIQLRLIDLSRGRTGAMAASRHLDMASLEPSIRRLQTTK